MAIGEKQGFFDWVVNGDATYPGTVWTKNTDTENESKLFDEKSGYSFLAGAINLADTSEIPVVLPGAASGIFRLPVIKKNYPVVYSGPAQKVFDGTMTFLKSLDLLIQLVSGTLIFGAIQNAGERLRASVKDGKGFGAGIVGFVGGAIAAVGRFGLFFTQILAGAIRMPFAIASGIVGVFVGIGVAATAERSALTANTLTANTKESALTVIIRTALDFMWPFAPNVAKLSVSALMQDPGIHMQSPEANQMREAVGKARLNVILGILSMTIAVILVALLATGTLGGGLVALPLVPQLAGVIGTALNAAFGWAGLTIGSAAAPAAGAAVLHGITGFFGIAGMAQKVVVATMLIGAASTFINNMFRAFKENVFGTEGTFWSIAVKKAPLIPSSDGDTTPKLKYTAHKPAQDNTPAPQDKPRTGLTGLVGGWLKQGVVDKKDGGKNQSSSPK